MNGIKLGPQAVLSQYLPRSRLQLGARLLTMSFTWLLLLNETSILIRGVEKIPASFCHVSISEASLGFSPQSPPGLHMSSFACSLLFLFSLTAYFSIQLACRFLHTTSPQTIESEVIEWLAGLSLVYQHHSSLCFRNVWKIWADFRPPTGRVLDLKSWVLSSLMLC